jgi:hypothetical protein
MSIHDFHSKLSSRNESSILFEALRHLRGLDNVQSLVNEEETAGGWNPWTDGSEHHRHAVASA